jgi:hypothetical protein
LPRWPVLLIFTSFSLIAIAANAEPETEAVQTVFAGYRSKILAGEGDAAAALLSQNTVDYYDEMRQLALFASAEAVRAQSLVNQMQVLMLRMRVPTEELESMKARDLIAHAVDQGWIGKNSVLQLQPGKVIAEGDVAVLHVFVDGQDAGPMFRFNREQGSWRLDLVPTTQASNLSLQMAAKRQGVSESELLAMLMESVLGKKLGPEAWTPPRTQP